MSLSKLLRNRRVLAAAITGLIAWVAVPAVWAQVAARPTPIIAESLPPQVDATFNAWDLDHNGSLSIGEFRTGYLALRRAGEMQGRLRRQFGTVDLDKNGAIDASEYGNLLLIKSAGKSAPPLSAFDANKNQRLEFGEYLALVRRMTERQTASPAAPGHKP